MTETQMIILGYVIFALWIPFMFLLGILLEKKTPIPKEAVRKIQHVLTSVAWLIGALFFGPTIHIVIINFLGFLALTFATFTNKLNFTAREDSKRSYGLMYFGLGTLIVITIGVFVIPDLFLLTSIPYYCLVFADGFAPLVSRLFKNKNIKITDGKTLIGSSSVFIISFIVVFVINKILGTNFDILLILAFASLCTVLELFGIKGTDNLLIELGVFGLLILNYYNLLTLPMIMAIILAPVILVLSMIKKSITLEAAIMGLIMSLSITFFSEEKLLLVILSLFLVAEIVSKFVRKKKEKQPRGFKQIFSITIVSIILSFIYYLTNNPIFLYTAYLVIIGQFADSMASDIGSLSNSNPIDIISGKEIEKGMSGGVSLLGTVAALITSIVGALIVIIFEGFIYNTLIIIVTVSFIGTLIDSVLGSTIQVKYKCNKCGKITDNKICCNNELTRVKGILFIDNTIVNLLTSFLTALIALALFMVL